MSPEEKQRVMEEFETWIKHPYTDRMFKELKKLELDNYRNATNVSLTDGKLMRALLVKGSTCAELLESFKKPLLNLIIMPGKN